MLFGGTYVSRLHYERGRVHCRVAYMVCLENVYMLAAYATPPKVVHRLTEYTCA
jgi:hypothetical protein